MASRVTGFYLSEEQIAAVDDLAAELAAGSGSRPSRSAAVGTLIDAHLLRRSKGRVPEVVVDGRRFVPARGKRS